MTSMKDLPDELASIIVSYIKPIDPKTRDIDDIIDLVDMADIDHEDLMDELKKLKQYVYDAILEDKYADDEKVVVTFPIQGEMRVMINKSDYRRITDGADFICDDEQDFKIKNADGVYEPIPVSDGHFEPQILYDETDERISYPEYMGEQLF